MEMKLSTLLKGQSRQEVNGAAFFLRVTHVDASLEVKLQSFFLCAFVNWRSMAAVWVPCDIVIPDDVPLTEIGSFTYVQFQYHNDGPDEGSYVFRRTLQLAHECIQSTRLMDTDKSYLQPVHFSAHEPFSRDTEKIKKPRF